MLTLNLEDRQALVLKVIAIFLSLVILSSIVGVVIFSASVKNITLHDNDKTIQVSTFTNSVRDLLNENNIILNEKDIITPAVDSIIKNGSKVEIKRAISIVVNDGTNKLDVLTNKDTIMEVLDENQIVLNEKDKLNVDLKTKIAKGLILNIIRVTEDTIVEQEKVAFNVTERETTSISRGFKRVVKQGNDGLKETTYKAIYENGQLVDKEVLSEKVIKKPTNGVVEVGVEPRVATSRGNSFRYAREIVMTATAYTAGRESTGKSPGDRGYGVTASGLIAQRGTVAVDPSVIPLGTKLYIESMDGFAEYGYAVAADTGGSIKGNKIDLFYETVPEALKFGRRKVKVYVLE